MSIDGEFGTGISDESRNTLLRVRPEAVIKFALDHPSDMAAAEYVKRLREPVVRIPGRKAPIDPGSAWVGLFSIMLGKMRLEPQYQDISQTEVVGYARILAREHVNSGGDLGIQRLQEAFTPTQSPGTRGSRVKVF